MGTKEADPISIMCYQLPGDIMKNGKPIKGGKNINPRDHSVRVRRSTQKRAGRAKPPPFDLEDIAQPEPEAAEPGSDGAAGSHDTAGARHRSLVPRTAERPGKRVRARDHGRVSAEP